MTEQTKAEIEGNMRLAVAMLATEMERDGRFSEVLSRPVVRESVGHARKNLKEDLGPESDEEWECLYCGQHFSISTCIAKDFVNARFCTLRDTLVANDRLHLSSNLNDWFKHPAYQEVIHLGPEVVPYIVDDLEWSLNNPDERAVWFWGHALRMITGANPIPEEHIGKIKKQAQDWITWWGCRWERRFIELARHISGWSKDPSTKVGCVVVGPDREIRATGFNGFPRGVSDDGRLHDRDEKYPRICHAEENAIMQAARTGVTLKNCTSYGTWPPCCRCARGMVQAGLKEVVFPKVEIPERWQEDFDRAMGMLHEAGIEVREIVM